MFLFFCIVELNTTLQGVSATGPVPCQPETSTTMATGTTSTLTGTNQFSSTITSRVSGTTNVETGTTSLFAAETTTSVIGSRNSTTTTTTTNSCNCVCKSSSNTNISDEEIGILIEQIKKNLLLERKLLSSHINTKNSAEDSRTSSKVMGTVGIIVLIFVFGIVVSSDAHSLYVKLQPHISI